MITLADAPERCVIRLAGNDTHLLGISREVEHAATVAAAGVGIGPEVTEGPDGDRIDDGKNTRLIEKLLGFDAIVVAGQAKSHCLAWTIDDLLKDDSARARLAGRMYLLEDCTSPVVVPGVVEYTDEADAAFERYAAAGMHVVRSTDPITSWPGLAAAHAATGLSAFSPALQPIPTTSARPQSRRRPSSRTSAR